MLMIFQYITYAALALMALYMLVLIYNGMHRVRVGERMAKAELEKYMADTHLVLERKREQIKHSELSWNNFRKFEVVRKHLEAKDTRSFYLAPHDRRPLPPFQPGQYLTFKLDVPGQKKSVTRCYSLSDSPNNEDYYRITVKRIPPPRNDPDAPAGISSSYFHDVIMENDIINVMAPSGNFYLDTDRRHPVVLIGGGIGLTPVLSMLNYIVESGSKQEVWFFYGVRNGNEHAMKGHLERIDRENENVHLHVCYSAPDEGEELGKDFQYQGRVSVDLFKQLLPSNNYDYYFCGPPPMMNSLAEGLAEWNVPESSIHFEAFGAASVKKKKTTTEKVSYDIKFARSGKTLNWNGESDSILEFAEDNDIEMSFGCRAGNCGSCSTAIKEGDVELVQEAGADCESGSCLTCVSIPKSNLVLDA